MKRETLMSAFLHTHYDTTGPFNLPMKDAQARALDAILKEYPAATPRFVTLERAPAELLPGDRADISWITTEDIDRDREIVVARGMKDDHFKLNPIVTLQHCYHLPPVGKSLWLKRASDGPTRGIKAKTQYPRRPDDWPDDWPPDITFSLIQAGLLRGKSIGFLPLKSHAPTEDEIRKRPDLVDCRRIIDEWLLLEYACVYLPSQQNAIVEAVSKGVAIPDRILDLFGIPKNALAPEPTVPFTTWDEINRSITRQIDEIDFAAIAHNAFIQGIAKAQGKV